MAFFAPNKGLSNRLGGQQIHDGSVWFTTDDGKLYIDAGNERKLINPDIVLSGTAASWATSASPSEAGKIYVVTDYKQEEDEQGNIVNIPGIKVGDGVTPVSSLAYVEGNDDTLLEHIQNKTIHVTASEKAGWDWKVSALLDPNDDGNLMLLYGVRVVPGDVYKDENDLLCFTANVLPPEEDDNG